MSIGITDLPVVDDLDVPVSADEYVDQANPAPVKPGVYRLQVVKAQPRTNKDGSVLLVGEKYPVIVLEQVKIVEPQESERQFGLFQDVRTKPGKRKNATGGDVAVSDLQDLLRSYAVTGFEGFKHMTDLLQEYIAGNATFVAEIGWSGYDSAYVDAQFATLGITDKAQRATVAKEVQNGIYNKARLRTKDFVINGVRQQSVVGPSGETINAKAVINRYYPADSDFGGKVKLGPFKK